MSAAGFLNVSGSRIEYRFAAAPPAARAPDIVMLHEGLGSVELWKDFPERLALATGCRVLAYSRVGHGRSSPLTASRRSDYHFDEARYWLPAVLSAFELSRPLLFGHSDGATIALIYAAEHPSGVAGVVGLAPHVKVEDITIAGLAEARRAYETTDLRSRLAGYHDDVDGVFWGWNRTWLEPGFRDWNIEALLPSITAPVLAVQGIDDEYATLEQIESIARHVAGTALLALTACGHSPHRDQPAAVLEQTRRFIDRIAHSVPAI